MDKKIPLRQCIGCREMKEKKIMLRIVKTSDQGIITDITGRKNGRGAYICKQKACLEQAIKNKSLERSFKMSISPDIYENLIKEFEAIEAK